MIRGIRVRKREGDEPPEGTLGLCVRLALGHWADHYLRFLAANVVWLAVALAGLALSAATPLGWLLVAGLVPATAGLTRVAAGTVRGLPVDLRGFLLGSVHQWPRVAAAASLQIGVLVLVTLNLVVALRGVEDQSAAAVAAGLLACAVGLAALGVAAAAWVLLLDPNRSDRGLRELARLALGVAVLRPVRLLVVVMVEVVLVTAVGFLLLLAVLAPTIWALVTAHVVLPVADRIEGGLPPSDARPPTA